MYRKPTPLETQGALQRSSRFLLSASTLIVLLLVAAVGTYAWYSHYRPCEVDAVEEASAILISQMKRYDDVYNATTNGTRTSIAYPVAVLQQILMDTQEIVVPACLRTPKSELINYMGTVIRAFQAFRAGEPDATIKGLLDESYTHVRTFIMELEAVNKCAPFCIP